MTTGGKKLMAHELTHTIQQGKSGSGAKGVQRRFKPSDASEEMIGKEFELNDIVYVNNGSVQLGMGTIVTIISWNNDNDKVLVSALGFDGKIHQVYIKKYYLKPVHQTPDLLYQYGSGADRQAESTRTGEQKIQDWQEKREEYERAKNMKTYEAELARLKDLQGNRLRSLNEKLIQETMYNNFDQSIVKWTNHYNEQIGKPRNWSPLDPNLVKSMIFQETQMGTAGKYLLPKAKPDFPMSRYILMQTIDSSGEILILMINEMSPDLAKKYKINDIKSDYVQVRKKYEE